MILIIAGSRIISGAEYVLKDYIEMSTLKDKMFLLTTNINEVKKLFTFLGLKKIYYSNLLGQTGVIKTRKLSSIIKKVYFFNTKKNITFKMPRKCSTWNVPFWDTCPRKVGTVLFWDKTWHGL